jgi:hypothetical protein
LAAADRKRIATRMARMIMGLIDLRQPSELARALLVTEAWPSAPQTRTRSVTRSRDASGANGQSSSTDTSESIWPVCARGLPSAANDSIS